MPSWQLKPGERIRRKDLHQEFGGRSQGGIGPSSRTPNVFIFYEPESGETHGYYDEWQDDGSLHYTGEGQRGDQQMKSGNTSILNHRSAGRALRVFEGARGIVRYVDEFELDENEPFHRTDAQETEGGQLREVIVFHLRPKQIAPGEPTSKFADVLTGPVKVDVPIERQQTEMAYVAPNSEPYEAERREQRLVLDFEAHLLQAGHKVSRQRLLPPGEARPIVTDLYDATTRTLVEAKGTVERTAVRMAIGQLADYRRFFDEEQLDHLAVLLPREPRPDLSDLLAVEGIETICRTASGFKDSTGGSLVE